VSSPGAMRLEALARLECFSFPRCSSPAWYDDRQQFSAAMAWTVARRPSTIDSPAHSFSRWRAPAAYSSSRLRIGPTQIPPVSWYPGAGNPAVQHTVAVWPGISRHRDVGSLITACEETHKPMTRYDRAAKPSAATDENQPPERGTGT
jgi:hypothetical protein